MQVQRLSGTDSLFLAGELPAWHQHVAGLTILDPTGVPGFGFETVLRRIDERLPNVPKLTWKLREVPLGLDRPVWVPDPDFDVRRHVRYTSVAAPGGPREVAAAASEILAAQLDRTRSLWEIWYLDGLANGRVGLLMKYHHSLLDGVSGTGMATLLFDLEPAPAPRPVEPLPGPEPEPSDANLLVRGLAPGFSAPLRMARYGLKLARRGADVVGYALSKRPKPDISAMLNAPRTSFNHSIGSARAMSFTSASLRDVKALQTHFDVKLNDIALAIASGALRIYLDAHGELPERTLTAGVPMSTRAAGDTGLDNKLTYVVVPLATDVDDVSERVRAIHTQSRAVKELIATLRRHPIDSVGDAAPPWMLGAAMRLAYRSHLLSYVPGMMNALVSNVAGPPFPLYVAGAPLVGIFSASVILEGLGVNITVFSFDGRFDFGIHVDPALVPDPWELAAAVDDAVAELMRAAGLGAPEHVANPFGDDPGA